MILDTLQNWQKYAWPNEHFAKGFEYLMTLGSSPEDGKTEIDGQNVYCMIQNYTTFPRDGREFEAHRDYADIQLVLSGEESILWADQSALTVTKPYQPDIEFYTITPPYTELVLLPNQFAVFYPQDAHAPCIARTLPGPVCKAVVKVRM